MAPVDSVHPLDRPAWHALKEKHADIAIRGELSARYPPDARADSPEWKELRESTVIQMTQNERLPVKGIEIIELGVQDIPEVVGIIEVTKPGPFAKRTVELGRYIGIRVDGKLVAMAGERFRMNGYSEISAVSVLPEYRGRGYAKELSSVLVNYIIEKGDAPPFMSVH